ncbi:hypothetical protein Tco_0477570 [Tanacetum coccineum]
MYPLTTQQERKAQKGIWSERAVASVPSSSLSSAFGSTMSPSISYNDDNDENDEGTHADKPSPPLPQSRLLIEEITVTWALGEERKDNRPTPTSSGLCSSQRWSAAAHTTKQTSISPSHPTSSQRQCHKEEIATTSSLATENPTQEKI